MLKGLSSPSYRMPPTGLMVCSQSTLCPPGPTPWPPALCLVTGPVLGPSCASHLVPGIRCVHSLLVTAGLQEDTDGIQLQEHLAGHRVKEGDVGKGRRGQQEDFPRRGLLAQFWITKRKTIASLNCPFTSVTSSTSHDSSEGKTGRVS